MPKGSTKPNKRKGTRGSKSNPVKAKNTKSVKPGSISGARRSANRISGQGSGTRKAHPTPKGFNSKSIKGQKVNTTPKGVKGKRPVTKKKTQKRKK